MSTKTTNGITVHAVEYHRNGIAGEPFYACRFTDDGGEFVATVFPAGRNHGRRGNRLEL